MKRRTFQRTRLAAAIGLGALLAPPSFTQQGPQPGSPSGPGQHGRMGVRTHGMTGVVTAISDVRITMEIPEGVAMTVEAGANTRITKDGQAASVKDIQVGDAVQASGQVNEQARTIDAVFVVVGPPDQARFLELLRARFGKMWTAGIVTAIQSDSITVRRRDGETQTFQVDANTVMRHAQTTLSLADIQVGERVFASIRGKDGSYIANTMNVEGMVAGGGRQDPQ